MSAPNLQHDSTVPESRKPGGLVGPDAGHESKTMPLRERRKPRPRQLDAGPFSADIASFRLHLAAEGKSPKTIKVYTEALAVYEDIRRVLADGLGADPGPGLQDMHLQVLRQDAALRVTATGPTLHNLPLLADSFIDREPESRQVTTLLAAHRLVTLTGTGAVARPGWRSRWPPGRWRTRMCSSSTPARWLTLRCCRNESRACSASGPLPVRASCRRSARSWPGGSC